jgi:nucleoside-diphosphate-sugar epimerase
MNLTIIGAGALGSRVAAQARRRNPSATIRAITATPARHAVLKAAGVHRVDAVDATDRDALTAVLPDRLDGHVLLAVPGSARQGAVLEALAGHLDSAERIVLIGTVGFHRPYDRSARPSDDGPVLTPDLPPAPPDVRDARTIAAIETEAAFRTHAGTRGVIVRCAGLWHAGEDGTRPRGPFAAYARRGIAPPGAPDAVLPLVHYDDAALLTWAVLTAPDPPSVLQAVTAQPRRQAFYTAAARALGFEAPAFTGSFDPREIDEPDRPPRFVDTAAAALWNALDGPTAPHPLDADLLDAMRRALKRHAAG